MQLCNITYLSRINWLWLVIWLLIRCKYFLVQCGPLTKRTRKNSYGSSKDLASDTWRCSGKYIFCFFWFKKVVYRMVLLIYDLVRWSIIVFITSGIFIFQCSFLNFAYLCSFRNRFSASWWYPLEKRKKVNWMKEEEG